jgi:uncharacterized membrane protein
MVKWMCNIEIKPTIEDIRRLTWQYENDLRIKTYQHYILEIMNKSPIKYVWNGDTLKRIYEPETQGMLDKLTDALQNYIKENYSLLWTGV